MVSILFVAHLLPYPPNRGDKLRAYQLLRHLAKQHSIHLGAFLDENEDAAQVEALREFCSSVHTVPLSPFSARLRSLNGLISNEALTVRYYRDPRMLRWVHETCRNQSIDAAVLTSAAMAQYVQGIPRLRTLVDFVDVDSARWTQLASARRWPKSWLSRREGDRLLAYERVVAAHAARSFFVTRNETELFRRLAPECGIRIETIGNGVDAEYFAPDPARPSPFAANEIPLVFSGNMEYLPNVDAVTWFNAEVMPRLAERWPQLRLHIVGRNPRAAVRALAGPAVVVTGTVADLRPYLQHAAVVIAPIRVARGVKNGVLEAMAMARPVVATTYCAQGIEAEPGKDLLTATTPAEFVQSLDTVLSSPETSSRLGAAARRRVLDDYDWAKHLAGFDRHIDGAAGLGRPPAGKLR